MAGTAGVLFAGADPNLLYELDGTDAADALGFSVGGGGDVNGDGRADFIVGVPFANPNGIINAGSAFIYSGLDGSLLYSINGSSPGDRVGGSVGLQGDVDGDGKGDYIVGAPGVNNLAGAAYVYSGATGLLMYQIIGSSPGERVGGSVGIYGDVDGDGKGDFIVGAPGTNDSTGAAFVYSGATGLLIYRKNGIFPGDRVGGSVGIYGDVNADGRADFIVGAPGTNSLAGAAYVYSGLDGSLLYQKNGSNPGDRVGGSVGIYGDVNGDSHADFIVGAPDADPGGLTDAGSAYVYSGLDGSLLFRKNGFAAGDRVGGSVGIQGDVNNDGKTDFIIGAPQADLDTLVDVGFVFVYSGLDGSLLYQKNGDSTGDRVGGSVGIMGDANLDGRAEFIIGAPVADLGSLGSVGLAYVYSGANGSLLYQKTGASAGEHLGALVSGAGDVDGDGRADFIVNAGNSIFIYSGATGNVLYQESGYGVYSIAGVGDVNGDGKGDFAFGKPSSGPNFSGSAYVYSGATGGVLYQENGPFFLRFGRSVAGAGDVDGDGNADFIIGGERVGAGGGKAYVYSGATGSLLYQLNGFGPTFGWSVAGAGDVNADGRADFIIGEYGGTIFGLYGNAYVYSGATGLPLYEYHENTPGPGTFGAFGFSVSGVGGDVNGDGKDDFIICASVSNDFGFRFPGRVYVYSGANGGLLTQKPGSRCAGAGDVNGDGRADFIVGAPAISAPGIIAGGSIFVFSGANGSLLFQKSGATNDQLGVSLAGAGDVNGDGRADIIIGNPNADRGELTDVGSAFVFTRHNTAAPVLEPIADQNVPVGSSLEFSISASDPDSILFLSVEPLPPPGARFIDSLNGRGSFQWTPTLSQTGVYSMRFIASDGDYADTQSVTLTVTADTLAALVLYEKGGGSFGEDHLGYSVSGAGDVNGDGKADFIIGAPFASSDGLTGNGSAFVYSGADGALLHKIDGSAAFDQLGASVAGAGDVNGDSKADFIIGALFASPGGSAYVYSGADGALLYQKDGAAANDRLGRSVAGAGDVNGDGKADFIIGAPEAMYVGSAYVYSGATGALLYQKDGGAGGYNLGVSVAGAGDVNGDGTADFIIGAPSPYKVGSAYVYSGADGSLLYQKNGAAADDELGFSVAGAGDVDGDGKADFIIGALLASPGGRTEAGSAYLYSGATGTLLYQKDGGAFGDRLGVSVAGAGDVNGDGRADFIIGADGEFNGGRAGSAFVFGLCPATKGDMNGDAMLTTVDAVLLLNCTFLGEGSCGSCFADVNCDGILSASDVVLELNKVFLSTPFPCP